MKITICTATYNRADHLHILYESLQSQTYQNFEWIIVDDDSTDNTKEEVENFIRKGNFFPIFYYKQDRGGKHRAVNLGISKAQGELFFVVDSDDYLVNNALERIVFWFSTIQNETNFAGIVCNIGNYKNELIGSPLEKEFMDLKIEDTIRQKISGDKARIQYTSIIKNYMYPEFKNEWHIAPSVQYVRLSKDGYYHRYVNEILYHAEYLEDGLTKMKNQKLIENINGYTIRVKEMLELDIPFRRKVELIGKYTFIANKYHEFKFSEIKNRIHQSILIIYFSFILYYFYDLILENNK